MSMRSPRSPSHRGFRPLGNESDNSSNPNMTYDNDIPLAPMRSNNSTGARKPGEGVLQNDFSSAPTLKLENEKAGLFHRGAAGRRKVKKIDSKNKNRVNTDGEVVSFNGLGRLYKMVVGFSVITRYMVYVAPLALCIATPIVVFAIVRPNATIGGMRIYLFFTWIEALWLSIWVAKLVAQAIPWLFMFLCGVVSSGTRKYAMILKAVELPLSFLGWAITALVTFTALSNVDINRTPDNPHGPSNWVVIVKRVLAPILIASGLLLGEKLVIQIISVNYHRRSFDARIKESKHTIYLLGLLYDASRTLFPMYCPEFLEEDYAINDSIEAVLHKTGYHKHSGSATPLKLIGDIGRVGDKVTSVFGNIASEITGKQVFNPTSAHSIVVEALEKKRSSEALAKRLWMSFVVEGKEALYAEDIEEVLGPARRDEAEEIFAALDNDMNGDISLDEMVMKVIEVGRDRKAISNSMRDVGQAIGVLDDVLVFILFIIVIFIFVAFQDTNFVTTLATAGTTLLSLSFVFAVTTQEFLGSCIFLFVKHPYDVGDRVDIPASGEKEPLVVEQISLLYTIFKRIDSMKMVQVPNIVLNTLWVENITRSKAMKEQLSIYISFDTTLEDIDTLRTEMESFVRHPDNSRDFQSDIILEAMGIGKMDALELKVEIRHKSNWHNETIRAARRSKFMCALVLAMRRVPIYAPGGGGAPLGDPANPSYSVAVSDQLAIDARQQAKDNKEAKRLVPNAPPPGSSGKTTAVEAPGEMKAAEQLNHRRPTDLMGGNSGWPGSRDDAATLGGATDRDGSIDIEQRNDDLDNLREGLLQRESTRGRRKPGEAIPPLPPSNVSLNPMTTQQSQAASSSTGFRSQVAVVLDEENEVGIHHTTTTNRDRDIRLDTLNPGTGPGQAQTQGQGMIQPRYVYPPTTPADTPNSASGHQGSGGGAATDYMSAGGAPQQQQHQRAANGMASTGGQSRLRGLSLVGSGGSTYPGQSISTQNPNQNQNQNQRQGGNVMNAMR